MKNLKTLALTLFITFSAALGNAQTKKINTTKSKITWIGKKITGQHEGTINLIEGSLVFKGAKIAGGTFSVDMKSLTVTDLKAGEGKEKLEGHLKTADFFGTEKFPTATLVFKTIAAKSATVFTVTADLTIKDKTNSITFDLTVSGNTAQANVSIDRTKFDIKYGSRSFFENLGDKAISDNFDLVVALQF